MSDRAAAFEALLTAVGIDPSSADTPTRRVIHDAACNYLRASGWTAPSAGTPRREASGERGAVSGDGWTFRFGKSKGQTPEAVDVRDLRWYERVFREGVDDPSKAQWRDANARNLDIVRAELRRRGEAADHG